MGKVLDSNMANGQSFGHGLGRSLGVFGRCVWKYVFCNLKTCVKICVHLKSVWKCVWKCV